MKYELLFKPLQVRSLILKNRIACAPMTGPGEGQPSIKPSALEYGGFSMFDRSIGGALPGIKYSIVPRKSSFR